MTINKKIRARSRQNEPGDGSVPEKLNGFLPSNPDPPQDGIHHSPPPPLMDLVFKFLKEFGYESACHQITVETQKRGRKAGYTKPGSWIGAGSDAPSLLKIWNEWQARHPDLMWVAGSPMVEMSKAQLEAQVYAEQHDSPSGKTGTPDQSNETDEESPDDETSSEGTSTSDEEREENDDEDKGTGSMDKQISKSLKKESKIPLPELDDDSSEEDSSSDNLDSPEKKQPATTKTARTMGHTSQSAANEEESSSETSDDSSDEDHAPDSREKPAINPLKRKATDSSDSSSSDSDSDSDSSGSEIRPAAKKAKIVKYENSEGSTSGSSSDTDHSSDEKMEDASDDGDTEDSESTSEDESSSGTSSDTSSQASIRAIDKTGGTKDKTIAKNIKPAVGGVALPSSSDLHRFGSNGSESSATLHATSPTFKDSTETVNGAGAGAHDVANGKDKEKKKPNAPFQRVSSNIEIDPRFASNQYVSYDYADRAHRDLSVVKGKSFTKEKNKKKRGSYRGGVIDTSAGRSIKFDD